MREAVLLVITMKSAFLTMKKTAQTAYVKRATLANHAVSVLGPVHMEVGDPR